MDNSNFNFNTEELESLLRKDVMLVNIVEEISKPIVKIESVEDYYNLFVAMLRTEKASLYNKEHLWILGIDENGYSRCAYLVSYADKLTFYYNTNQLLATGIMNSCSKMVLAYYKNTNEEIEITNDDLIFASYVHRRAEIVNIELIDYILISSHHDRANQDKTDPNYKSLKEAHFMDSVVSRAALDMDRIELEQDIIKKKRIEIAIELILMNMSIENIAQATKLTLAEVEKIKDYVNSKQ